ncbi:hypothetical protein P154DRAFT_573880 [Amniculicola lignicola CBS 123094]|uniref:Uncharacterized protein n=1 Tax=Amniculicola lignicola CBS 123094 TaxID=1392246 RepID=A0A6A5WPI5_9PLEO|nr:hypothetical protein P154DRAFT_573880 [Amniculicola lignicola CBS 123094]
MLHHGTAFTAGRPLAGGPLRAGWGAGCMSRTRRRFGAASVRQRRVPTSTCASSTGTTGTTGSSTAGQSDSGTVPLLCAVRRTSRGTQSSQSSPRCPPRPLAPSLITFAVEKGDGHRLLTGQLAHVTHTLGRGRIEVSPNGSANRAAYPVSHINIIPRQYSLGALAEHV